MSVRSDHRRDLLLRIVDPLGFQKAWLAKRTYAQIATDFNITHGDVRILVEHFKLPARQNRWPNKAVSYDSFPPRPYRPALDDSPEDDSLIQTIADSVWMVLRPRVKQLIDDEVINLDMDDVAMTVVREVAKKAAREQVEEMFA